MAPRLASWNAATHPDQVRLNEYLDDTEDLLNPSRVSGDWSLLLDVGLTEQRNLLALADLDNFAYPLAKRLQNDGLVSVWCTKRHGPTSFVAVAQAERVDAPGPLFGLLTSSSYERVEFKEAVRASVSQAELIPPGPVELQIAFTIAPRRNWLNLWKPTIDALAPILGRATPDRRWHPLDGRITVLGLHRAVDPSLGNTVEIDIFAASAPALAE